MHINLFFPYYYKWMNQQKMMKAVAFRCTVLFGLSQWKGSTYLMKKYYLDAVSLGYSNVMCNLGQFMQKYKRMN